MKRNLNSLLKYQVSSKDGHEGPVIDFLFDHDAWIVRYIEADFGKWFNLDRVLVPTIFLENPDWDNQKFPVRLTKDDIESGPNLEDHATVSKKFESDLLAHYNLEPYWLYTGSSPIDGELLFPARPLSIPPVRPVESEIETSLRSYNEVTGYRVMAGKEETGYIYDLIADDNDWQIVYAVVDFSRWLPLSKKVLVSIEGIEEISYFEQLVKLSVSPDKLRNAPPYHPDQELSAHEEKENYDYFSWGMVT